MSEATEQAVVEKTDDQAKPGAEVADARDKGDDLDALLSQFDGETQTQKTEPKSTPEQSKGNDKIDPDEIARQVTAKIEADNRFKADVNHTIKTIRGDLPEEVFDDTFMRAFLDAEAEKEPRLAQAFRERHAKPKEFAKVAGELAKRFAGKFAKLPDRAATEDRELVADAVTRGASKQAPESKAPDFSRMSTGEYREAHFKEYGYYPNV